MNKELRKPFEYIKEAFRFYFKKENFIFFAKIMAVLTIVSTSLSFISNYLYPVNVYENFDVSNVYGIVGFITISFLMILFGIYNQSTTLQSVLNQNTNIKSIFVSGLKKMWKYFLAVFIVGLIVVGGAVLLLIPGLIFAVWFSFTLFLVIDKDMGLKQALKRSKDLVKGRFWMIIGRFLVIGLFNFLVTIFLSIFSYSGSIILSFIAPLLVLPGYLLYKDVLAIAAK